MGPNRTICFKLDGYEGFGGYEHMPKGDLFRFGVNPFNGTVVLSFQERQENALEVIETVSRQLSREIKRLRMQCGNDCTLRDLADTLEGKNGVELKPMASRIVELKGREDARKVG